MDRRRPRKPPTRPLVLIVDGHEDRRELYAVSLPALGIDVITATMPYKQLPSAAEQLDALGFRTNINLKTIPAADGSGAAVRELTAREFADVEIHEVWTGPATLELRPNAQAPVYLLPVLEVEEAFHWRASFTLAYGRVLETL